MGELPPPCKVEASKCNRIYISTPTKKALKEPTNGPKVDKQGTRSFVMMRVDSTLGNFV